MSLLRTSTTERRFSRRALLHRMGVGAAMLPLLHSERVRGAGPGGLPRRLITIGWSNGVAQPSFYPESSAKLTDPPILKPLAPFKDKVTVVAGLEIQSMFPAWNGGGAHWAMPSLFAGSYKDNPADKQDPTTQGASVDQAVSDWVARSVNLPIALVSTSSFDGKSRLSWSADGRVNTAETNPARLFKTLFAGRTIPPTQLEALKARRKSILDYVHGELDGFKDRLGTDDRAKIDGHLDSVRKLELELQAAVPMCNEGAAPPSGDYQKNMKAFIDLVVIALKCDVSRTFAMLWAHDGGSNPGTLPWLNLTPVTPIGLGNQTAPTADFHAIAHQGPAQYTQKTLIDTWFISQLGYLATGLDAIKELGSTALDNSLVVMGNSMAEGANHRVDAIPLVMLGGGGLGGAIKPGRLVKVGTWAGKTGSYWKTGLSGVPNNRLLASVASALGVPADSFGEVGPDGRFKYPGNLNAELRG